MPAPQPDDDRVAFSLKRTHLYAFGGAVAGFAAGAITVLSFQQPQYAEAAPGSAAQGQALAQAAPMVPAGPLVNVSFDGRPFRGGRDAAVTIVEFTDYQCPFCRRHFETTLPAIMERYGDRVRYVVRNFPIPQLHPTAPLSALAAECAFAQNRFWEYHDRLFVAATHDNATFKAIARQVGLNTARFDRCLDNGEKNNVVEQDIRDGVAAGVAGTPAFFVNGRFIDGAMPLDVFVAVIDDALQKAAER